MEQIIDTLPVLHRLALAYAPSTMRGPTLALLALDARLADTLRSASEPMLAQIRMAWWRDMLMRDAAERPAGEPLLESLQSWNDTADRLAALVDGWEHLVSDEPLDRESMLAFCAGRGAAFAALADLAGCSDFQEKARAAGSGWALGDLAARLDAPGERDTAQRLLREHDWGQIVLPRSLRPLALLHGLAARAGRKGQALDAASPGAFLPALRIGLFGR